MAEESPSTRLRRFGFRIKSRPRKGPVLWERHGATFTEAEALKRTENDLKAIGK